MALRVFWGSIGLPPCNGEAVGKNVFLVSRLIENEDGAVDGREYGVRGVDRGSVREADVLVAGALST